MCFCKNAIQARLDARLIYDNAASRTGRGTDFAVRRLHKFIRSLFTRHGTNDMYFLKCDISKYFASIDHEILLGQLRHAGFSDDEMWYMNMVIKSQDGARGLPLGNQTSQWFALLYLNKIDRFIKEKLRIKHYVRYMDDFVLLHPDKEFLQMCRTEITRVCQDKLKLQLNTKTQIGRVRDGVDFLGFNHKITSTGRIVMRVRASARTRRYLKNIAYFYNRDIIDDDYLQSRLTSLRAHMRGTIDRKFITNKIQTMRRAKHRKSDTHH